MCSGSFLSQNQILHLLAHRSPFLFLSRARGNVVGKSVMGVMDLDSLPSSELSRSILLEGLGQSGALIIRQVGLQSNCFTKLQTEYTVDCTLVLTFYCQNVHRAVSEIQVETTSRLCCHEKCCVGGLAKRSACVKRGLCHALGGRTSIAIWHCPWKCRHGLWTQTVRSRNVVFIHTVTSIMSHCIFSRPVRLSSNFKSKCSFIFI